MRIINVYNILFHPDIRNTHFGGVRTVFINFLFKELAGSCQEDGSKSIITGKK